MFTIQLTEEQIASLNLRDGKRKYNGNSTIVRSPEDLMPHVAHMGELDREHFGVASLTSRNHLIAFHVLSVGTVDAALVHPREVFRQAIMDNAVKIIVVHNHPSGDTTPSEDDELITRRLKNASKIMGIGLIDHLVIGRDGEWTSLQNLGYLN